MKSQVCGVGDMIIVLSCLVCGMLIAINGIIVFSSVLARIDK